MSAWQWLLELALIGLLAATLFHALRLEKALGVLKRDRAALEELVAGFNASTRQAEAGIEQLRAAADGAGRLVARQVETGRSLQDDLTYLIERGERSADRLEQLVRAARPMLAAPAAATLSAPTTATLSAPTTATWSAPTTATSSESARETEDGPRLRSQAERDLLNALRLAR
ncbi:MAG: DUF6468 domain-containing protein [Pseudomonadota bacterium]|nr:DUF6468 domain-containing protein [Pseudomonadota bacterium]